jgi:hypothetical protein
MFSSLKIVRGTHATMNKNSEPIITSIWRPLRRAACTFLLGITVLWVMPRTARAQLLYVSQYNTSTVGVYNASTGAKINPSLIAGLSEPFGLALSGNTLFVSDDGNDNVIGKYVASTGSPINAAFIPGVNAAFLALSGSTIYVANYGGSTIDRYNASTGAPIGTNPIY